MTEPIDELGPVDYLVVEFPGSQFNGEILPELLALVRHGVVRILDLAVIRKNEDGSYEAFEFEDLQDGPLAELREVERDLAQLLSDDDVAATADALEPGSPPPCSCTRTFGRRRWPRRCAGPVVSWSPVGASRCSSCWRRWRMKRSPWRSWPRPRSSRAGGRVFRSRYETSCRLVFH